MKNLQDLARKPLITEYLTRNQNQNPNLLPNPNRPYISTYFHTTYLYLYIQNFFT